MKRSYWYIIGLIIIIILVVGGYFLFRNPSPKYAASNNNATGTNNTPSTGASVIQTKTSPSLGQYLADTSGRALYTYGGDTKNVSNCTGSCLSAWPPYIVTASVTNLPAGVGTFKRSDTGALQYTYNGLPLYRFTSDSNGQVTGNGVDNFSVAKPSSQPGASNSPSSGNSSNSNPY